MNRMRAKSQPPVPSEVDAKEKLIVYVYEYLTHCGATNAAQSFLNEIRCEKEIKINESPGFLVNWWCVFWDLYCAAPEKRTILPESSQDARAFMDFRNVLSPACSNTSPPQQQPPPFMGGPGSRYGGPMPPHGGHIRGPARMQGPPPGSMPGGPPQPYMGGVMAGSPRYAPHPSHMTPPGASGGMYPEPGPSPGVSRMTPSHSGSPHPQLTPTPQLPGPQSGGGGQPVSGPIMSMPGGQRPVPPQSNWQPSNQVSYNVNSPVGQSGGYMLGPPVSAGSGGHSDMGSMMNDNGMMEVKSEATNGPPTPQPSEGDYVIPPTYQENDQNETAEILKVKQSLQEQTKQEFDFQQNNVSW